MMVLVYDEKSTADTPADRMHDPNWWRQAAIYQVYPRSFADGNGDGVGDLRGVLTRIDYLTSLNVDAVWFSPFYPSALADGGYDVDDYRNVDPLIGTLEEFDQVIAALHGREIKVVIDIVPNHSSDRHVWFREALSGTPGSRARERYLFRDGRGEHGELPPSDWQSFFGGPAWTRVTEADGRPGQWYLHLFTPEQPDWNWENREVRDDFLRTLRFWGDRGVDGFRVDVAMGLAKDMSEPFAPWLQLIGGIPLIDPTAVNGYGDGQHPLFDRDEVGVIYAEWRQVFNSYNPPLFAVAEAWVAPHRRKLYATSEGLGQAFNFDLLAAPWNAEAFRDIIRTNLDLAAETHSTTTWVFSNHDIVRHATRFAQPNAETGRSEVLTAAVVTDDAARARGLARAIAATTLVLALPGSSYIYQGEELGLPEVQDIPADQVQDPWARIENGVAVSTRDGSRVPLPWTASGPFFGYSNGASHLHQPDWFGQYSIDTESADPSSTLSVYRRALALRHEWQSVETLTWLDLGPDVVAFRRSNGWTSVTNFRGSPIDLPAGRALFRSDQAEGGPLPENATAWIVTAE